MTNDSDWYRTAGKHVGQIYDDIRDDGYEMPSEVARAAEILADVVGDGSVDWAATRPPKVIATCCLYVADTAIRGSDRIAQSDLADAAPASAPTIRNHYHDIPAVFLEHATESERTRLGEEFISKLRMYRDAEAAGIGMANVDPTETDSEAFHRLADSLAEVQQYA